MKKNIMLVTILVIAGLSVQSHATDRGLSVRQQATLNVASECQSIKLNQKLYNELLASGTSQSDALSKAAVGPVKFDQYVYNEALAAGMSQADAQDLATSYNYSDDSRFCKELRTKIRSEMFQVIK